ncbi:MAG: hypothetical protein J7M26_08065, partial [Armatimonadetes bacterium]|nr:hypothetical protein [Armatimonadota bacterium]
VVIWTWALQAGREIAIEAEPRRLGHYTAGLEMAWPGEGKSQARARAELGEKAVLRFKPAQAGPTSFAMNAGSNAYRILKGPAHLALEASARHPFHLLGGGEVYFYVPEGTREFTAVVRGQGAGETARVTVYDPADKAAGTAEALKGMTARVPVKVREGQGKVWKLVISKASEGTLEDVYLYLEGDVPPYVFLSKEGALVPFCYGLRAGARLVKSPSDATLHVTLTTQDLAKEYTLAARVERKDKVVARGQTRLGERTVALRLPSLSAARYTAVAELRDRAGKLIATKSAPVEMRNGILYVGGISPLLDLAVSWPQTPTEPVKARLGLSLQGLQAKEVSVSASLYRCGVSQDPLGPDAKLIASDAALPRDGDQWIAQTSPQTAEGTYEWVFTVSRAGNTRPLFWQRVHWVVFRNRLFPEVGTSATPPPEDQPWLQQGIAIAVPDVQDAVPYSYLPSMEELRQPLETRAARGETRTAVAVLIAGRNLKRVSASVSDLEGPSSTKLPAKAVDLRMARYWAQRTSWNTGNCRIVPELLEKRDQWAMRALQPAILWLNFPVPSDARPGVYRGRLTVEADGRKVTRAIALHVYPFALAQPREYHWGLYTDSGRWRHYSLNKIANELRDYREHGITSLMMYPANHSAIALQDGKLAIEASEFIGYMDLTRKLGLREPTVLSFQSLAGIVNRLVDAKKEGQQRWDQVYRDVCLWFDRQAKEHKWGEVVYHAIDEPHGKDSGARAIHLLSIIKKGGLTTFTTALDPTLVNGPLDPYLDVRCWSVGYVLASKQANEKARADCRRSHDRLWYYGSGSYTGQEGAMLPNRWIAGCGLWISGAEGVWSWTFLRPKDNPFNDFDGTRNREAKDAMIAYPSQGDGPPIPTPQWEGLRAAANDFRYLYTAREVARRRGGRVGSEALKELQALTERIPYGVRPQGVDSAVIDGWREQAARLIERCL